MLASVLRNMFPRQFWDTLYKKRLLPCILKVVLSGANKAEAHVVVPVRRSIVVPVRNRRVVGVVVPRTATVDAVRARSRTRLKNCR